MDGGQFSLYRNKSINMRGILAGICAQLIIMHFLNYPKVGVAFFVNFCSGIFLDFAKFKVIYIEFNPPL